MTENYTLDNVTVNLVTLPQYGMTGNRQHKISYNLRKNILQNDTPTRFNNLSLFMHRRQHSYICET